VPTPSVNIIGSTVFEQYSRDLPKKILFTETATILPAFNDFKAYSANVTAALSIPVFKRLSATVSTTDNYLNDPAPFFQKNSYQFITGVTYMLR
jgi:heme-binding NEAT domain protein